MMRFIDTSGIQLDPVWLKTANSATQELAALGTQADRNAYIKANDRIWSDRRVKETLMAISHNKCWYSEVSETMSDWHVDHFRPKNLSLAIDRSVLHAEGYWWLAFNWTNYRIASTYCNCRREGGGKGEYFPLQIGSALCACNTDPGATELHCLLDPTCADDVKLISFNEAGQVIAASSDEWENERVKVSVELYNLEHSRLVDARKRVWDKCHKYIQRMKNGSTPGNENLETITLAIEDIRELINQMEPLSSVARACLMQSGFQPAIEIANSIPA